MYMQASFIAFVALFHQALTAPSEVRVEERALQNNCNRDNLFRSFIDPRYSASASAFCSTYIRSTVKATTTQTATTTVTASKGKRDLPATTSFPASRLSSACSCILTAAPSPTTVSTKVVTTVTVTKSSTCSVPTPIVKNGDFETGALAPWTFTPYANYSADLLISGVKGPGYGGSKYALIATNKGTAIDNYVELDYEQSLTVCQGAKYNFAAKFYLTDPRLGGTFGTKQLVHVAAYVDDVLIAFNKDDAPAGPPIVWLPLTGTFTATSNKAQLRIQFSAQNLVAVEWGVDNVVVTPA